MNICFKEDRDYSYRIDLDCYNRRNYGYLVIIMKLLVTMTLMFIITTMLMTMVFANDFGEYDVNCLY